jgi:hypothetical protein
MQRQYNIGLNTVTKSISQVVDKNRYPPTLTQRGPANAWNSSGVLSAQDLAGRRNGDDSLYSNRNMLKKPPKYKNAVPTYATDVSHLVV